MPKLQTDAINEKVKQHTYSCRLLRLVKNQLGSDKQ
jgi:hypothetical protein